MKTQIARFVLVGLANTALGFGIILTAMYLGMGDYFANALGYGLSLGIAYALHRRYTFSQSWGADRTEMTRFMATVAVSYCVNLAVLGAAREAGYVSHPLAQLAAMAAYSTSFFVLAKGWVFVSGQRASRPR